MLEQGGLLWKMSQNEIDRQEEIDLSQEERCSSET